MSRERRCYAEKAINPESWTLTELQSWFWAKLILSKADWLNENLGSYRYHNCREVYLTALRKAGRYTRGISNVYFSTVVITVAAKIWIFESEATIKARARCWSVARTVTWHPLLHHHGICKKAERAGTIIPECGRWMFRFFYRWCRFANASCFLRLVTKLIQILE